MIGLLCDGLHAAVIAATGRVLDGVFAARLFVVWLLDRSQP